MDQKHSAHQPDGGKTALGHGATVHGHTAAALAEEGAEKAAVYVCPMHAEIRRGEPGRCPICNMGLAPETAVLSEAMGDGHGACGHKVAASTQTARAVHAP